MISETTRARLDNLCESFEASETAEALNRLEDTHRAVADLLEAAGIAETITDALLDAVRPFLAPDADEYTVAEDLSDALAPLTRKLEGWTNDDAYLADAAMGTVAAYLDYLDRNTA